MEAGKLVILSGPSGVGKDTVIDAWRLRNPRVRRVVAFTSRERRPSEVDGVDYHFVSRERFVEYAQAGEFLEHKEVHGNLYGTPWRDVERMIAEGFVAVLKIDVQGALAVMGLRPEAISVFLLPPDADELERRIRARGTEERSEVIRRLQNARDELALAGRYGFRLINDQVEEVVAELERIVRDAV